MKNMEEKIILVDKNDQKTGEQEKLKCHQGEGLLHRAFTSFLINNKNEILLTKRSAQKPLWSLSWETSCSSHQNAPSEGTIEAAKKRIKYELGVNVGDLELIDKFYYKARYNKNLIEHEICWVAFGKYSGEITPNPKEVADFKWQSIKDLEADMAQNQKVYVPWLKPALDILKVSLGI